MDIVIFEDHPTMRKNLENMIAFEIAPQFQAELVYSTGEMEALSKFIAKRSRAAVYLIDIRVGEDNIGFLLSEKIWKKNDGSKVVYISDYPGLWFSSIHEQVKSIVCLRKSQDLKDKLTQLFGELQEAEPICGYFVLGNQFESYQFPYDQIVYLETVKGQRYIEVVTTTGRAGPIPNFKHTFMELCDMLNKDFADNPKFVQINPGVIINKDRCIRRRRKRRGGTVEMENGEVFNWTNKFRGATFI